MAQDPKPIQCSLEPLQAAHQVAEWADVRSHVLQSEEVASGVKMTFPARLRSALEDLAARESSCCSFLDISVELVDEQVVVLVTSDNPKALPTIGLLSGRPAA